MKSFFVFDVESVGLHGEGFAVAGGVYLENGAAQWEFRYACPISECVGDDSDRQWVKDNIPAIPETYRTPRAMRDAFWAVWMKAKQEGATAAADCLRPVEGGFIAACIKDDPEGRKWDGPYPLMEIASFLAAAGMDPLAKYDRTPSELPVHDPLSDARQSARMLSIALARIEELRIISARRIIDLRGCAAPKGVSFTAQESPTRLSAEHQGTPDWQNAKFELREVESSEIEGIHHGDMVLFSRCEPVEHFAKGGE